jgi:hypothetical protein
MHIQYENINTLLLALAFVVVLVPLGLMTVGVLLPRAAHWTVGLVVADEEHSPSAAISCPTIRLRALLFNLGPTRLPSAFRRASSSMA